METTKEFSNVGSFDQQSDLSHILIIDDDIRIRELLTDYLLQNNCRVTAAANAAEARRKMVGLQYDLLLLDLMMPGEDGLSFAKALREEGSDIPILMLSARGSDCCIEGLEAGADDYMSKPFDPRELILRVNSGIRRRKCDDPGTIEHIVFGEFTFAVEPGELKKRGKLIRLTDREKDILKKFTNSAGKPVSRLDLVANNTRTGERTIDVQINGLRRKIERDPKNPRYLQTVRGQGYRLCIA